MYQLFARETSDLEWLFQDAEGDIKQDVRSLQSGFEAEMEKRARRARHRPFQVREYDGRFGRVLWSDTGMRCGPVFVGDGDDGDPGTPMEISRLAAAAVRREARIRSALAHADAQWLDGSGPPRHFYQRPPDYLLPWEHGGPAAQRPSIVLRLRFREVLPACRQHPPEYLLPFLGDSHGCLVPFGLAGGNARRARPINAALGVRQTAIRGAGSLAHLTAAAAQGHAKSRSRRPLHEWVAKVGIRICAGDAKAPEWSLVGKIREQARQLEQDALQTFARATPRAVPPRVRRAALARMAAVP